MKLKMSFLSTAVLLPIISPMVMFSCSSTKNQTFIDEFYQKIVTKKDWDIHNDVYASSIYNLETFIKKFPSSFPSKEELLSKGYIITLEDIIPIDSLGSSNYTVYLRDSKTQNIYWPTPTIIGTDNNGEHNWVS